VVAESYAGSDSRDCGDLPGHAVSAAPHGRDGWRHELIRDEHGNPAVLVAVRVGATWTDSVVIEGEDRAVAMRHRTDSDRLIVPAGLSGGSGAVTMCSLSCSSYSAGSGSPWTPAGRGGMP